VVKFSQSQRTNSKRGANAELNAAPQALGEPTPLHQRCWLHPPLRTW